MKNTPHDPSPVRIQRKRSRGFNLQSASPNGLPVVYVGRPGRFGNPWLKEAGQLALDNFEAWLSKEGPARFPHLIGRRQRLLDALHKLRGVNLACWCPLNQPCHADVLLRLVNSDAPPVVPS